MEQEPLKNTMIAELERELMQREIKARSVVENRLYVLSEIEKLFSLLKSNKPNDRTEQDRLWAIAVTDMQKLRAFFKNEVVNG